MYHVCKQIKKKLNLFIINNLSTFLSHTWYFTCILLYKLDLNNSETMPRIELEKCQSSEILHIILQVMSTISEFQS